MPWESNRIRLPKKWWEAARDKDRLPRWFRDLMRFGRSRGYTHMHTQTYLNTILDPFQIQKRYCRFLAAQHSRFHLTEALWAVEPHPGGHGLHMHALWKSSYDGLRTRLLELQPNAEKEIPPLYQVVKSISPRYGGYSRLWPIDDPNAQVVAYCLKYVLKDLKTMDSQTLPAEWEPMQKEACWGVWTPE